MASTLLSNSPIDDSSREKSGTVTQSYAISDTPETNGKSLSDLSSAMEKTTISSPRISSPLVKPVIVADDAEFDLGINDDEHEAFREAVKKEIASALTGNTRAPKQHIKFSTAETEANTNANSYFGNSSINSPSSTPIMESNKQLGSADVSDIEDGVQKTPRRGSRSRTPGSANRFSGSRSRSRGVSHGTHGTPHAGVMGHFMDPNSPSAAFEHRVAFDTFDNKNATDFSLTLNSKHEDYEYYRLSRTFLCGTDKNKYSENAVKWLLEELAQDGDEIVCLRVIDPYSKISNSEKALEEKRYRDEAHAFLEHIMTKNTRNRKISLVLEFAVGGVESLIKRMIQIYEPSILIVGTKGRSMEGFKGLLPGSVSKWCLQHSPIPVVVVKPTRKREGQKAKREANPNKMAYLDMIAAHPDETPKIYKLMSSSNLLAPQIPVYLRHNSASNSMASLLPGGTASLPNLEDPGRSGSSERLGRFDRLRSRSRSPMPPRS